MPMPSWVVNIAASKLAATVWLRCLLAVRHPCVLYICRTPLGKDCTSVKVKGETRGPTPLGRLLSVWLLIRPPGVRSAGDGVFLASSRSEWPLIAARRPPVAGAALAARSACGARPSAGLPRVRGGGLARPRFPRPAYGGRNKAGGGASRPAAVPSGGVCV